MLQLKQQTNMFLSSFICLLILFPLKECSASFPNVYNYKHKVNFPPTYEGIEDPLILTPLILAGRYQEAQSKSEVRLKGFGSLKSYSGYFTVNKEFNSNLFFWFFPAEENFTEAPVILWLQGGPGATSLSGLFEENGPLEFKDGNHFPTLRKYSWTKAHSVIYIDNPVGTGYSFTDAGGFCTNETQVGEHLYEALQQFFTLFPSLQKNDFFITGESYAGKYVPSISYTILKKNVNAQLKINLKGLCIGNGLSDPINQLKYSEYLYQLGLIDSRTKAVVMEYERRGVNYITNGQWLEAFEVFDELINGDLINFPTLYKNATGLNSYFNYLETPHKTNLRYSFADYVTSNEIRAALHVGNVSFGADDDNVEKHLMSDVMQSVAPLVSELLENYRVLIYNGQLDVIVAYPLTINYLQKLEFSSADYYKIAPRSIWYVGKQVAGYIKTAGNLTEVLVRNAGHMVPKDQPEFALDLITNFIKGTI